MQSILHVVTFGAIRRPGAPSGSTAPSQPPAPPRAVDRNPGYQKASMLRELAESLHILLTSGTNGAPNWNAVKATDGTGCIDIRVQFEEVLASINRSGPESGRTTVKAAALAQHGIGVSIRDGRW